ncbi:MAG: lysylphosphatidylglycerol synthase transmembrane domain-containing protein, partial [Candidatus Aenigmatarchaeota archaeon]
MDLLKISMYLISIVLIVLLIYFGDIPKLIEEVKKVSIELIIILLILTIIYTFLRVYRFYFLLRKKYEIGFFSLFPIFAYGIALSNLVPARFSEPIRAYILKKEKNIPFSFSMACVFFERLSDVMALLFFSSVLFLFVDFKVLFVPFFVSFALILIAIIATQNEKVYGFFVAVCEGVCGFFESVFRRKFKIGREIINGIKSMYKEMKLSKEFAIPLIISMLIWVVDGLTFFLPLAFLGEKTDFVLILSIYSISLLIGLISFLPGGFGSFEASMTFLLAYIGISYQKALIATLLGRFFGLGLLM